ncbi:helix-turn-helix transcriptional regulator [Hydrogenophaga sp. RWCD_12]|uniref:helix-turn-helix transcriptional regulator n=1 Tax=Hydrogenophaga sp. RWCD_12 TaxID=3391190 RepID=UPI003984E681
MPRRQTNAWLDHLELLAGLPYPAPVLMPTVLAALRRGFNADFGGFGLVSGERLQPVAYWTERMTVPALRALAAHQDEMFTEFPLRQQLESDGEVVRLIQASPGYEDHWHHREILEPLGIRWAMCVPVLDQQGACDGFLYLYRSAAGGPFTNDEQALLRAARDRLRALHEHPEADLPPCPLRPAGTAVLNLDAAGAMLAKGQKAIELLYLCHDARMGMLDWAADDLTALPAPARDMLQSLLSEPAGHDVARCTLNLDAGRFDFRAERLLVTGTGQPQVAVTITHLEPTDITVARQLMDWPLSTQEKRILVASTRQPSSQQLASHLGVTTSTLKSYINRLQAKLEQPSRQAIIDQLLAEASAAHL